MQQTPALRASQSSHTHLTRYLSLQNKEQTRGQATEERTVEAAVRVQKQLHENDAPQGQHFLAGVGIQTEN